MTIHNERTTGWRVFAYIVMVFFTLLTIGPLFWLFYSSLKPHQDIIQNIFSFPKTLFFENYTEAWRLGKLGIYSMNSIIYTAIATGATTMLALMTGYGFAKFGYDKLTGFFYKFFILGMLITAHSVLVPLFLLEVKLNIDDTRIGVILPYIAFGLPFLIYLATSYIKGIPSALEEAALIDGANYGQIFRMVILPMAVPVTATMIIYNFLGNWNEFIFVFILTSKTALRSLPVGINAFAGGMSRNYGLQFAALVIGTIPMIVFYLFFHKQLKKGFSAGAVKE